MSDEIERLREFAAEYQKITGEPAEPILRKISALEAAADPWREAKKSIDHWRSCGMWPDITGLYDHLSAENARLEKRVKEFRHGLACMVSTYGKIDERSEIAVKHARKLIECEGEEIDVSFDVKDVADMQPPFEGPIVGFDSAKPGEGKTVRTVKYTDAGPLKPRDVSAEFDAVDDEPVLDPARVLATAAELGWGPTVYAEMTLLRDAKPYRLKGAGE